MVSFRVLFSVVWFKFLGADVILSGLFCDCGCFISSWYASLSLAFARYCRQRVIPFSILYEWWELKFKYCPVKVGFQYTDDQNLCSVRVDTSRKDYLLSCSFSIVNCIWLSSHDGFSDEDPNAISSTYSMYTLANTADNGDFKASPSYRYMSDLIPK